MIAQMLAGAVGGDKARWLDLIGLVKWLPIATNAMSNWRISPTATGEELAAIVTEAEPLHAARPYVIL